MRQDQLDAAIGELERHLKIVEAVFKKAAADDALMRAALKEILDLPALPAVGVEHAAEIAARCLLGLSLS